MNINEYKKRNKSIIGELLKKIIVQDKLDIKVSLLKKLKKSNKSTNLKGYNIFDKIENIPCETKSKNPEYIDIPILVDDDQVILEVNEEWNGFIEKVKEKKEEIKEYISDNNRLNTACENHVEKLSLHSFGVFYLVATRLLLDKATKPTITINPYTSCYWIKEKNVDNLSKICKEYIFRKDKISIEEFVFRYCEYLIMNKDYKEKKHEEKTSINFDIESDFIDRLKKNILFKGVPGTGKSITSKKITDKFSYKGKGLGDIQSVLRINIHSASSNADLMQGIGVVTNSDNQIIYKEKRGLILEHIFNAIKYPKVPFFLVLEEIQENTLNELIGDLIYLIEEDKRTNLTKCKVSSTEKTIFEHINYICENNDGIDYVSIPNLVEGDGHITKKIIFPDNLYLMCTTNYREDKKIIEDNLFRRFEVIDILPNEELIEDKEIKEFFSLLNKYIIEAMSKDLDIHPDRYVIGHANWMKVRDSFQFNSALLKLVNEFKEIREIEFEKFNEILQEVNDKMSEKNWTIILNDIQSKENYFQVIQLLTKRVGYIDSILKDDDENEE